MSFTIQTIPTQNGFWRDIRLSIRLTYPGYSEKGEPCTMEKFKKVGTIIEFRGEATTETALDSKVKYILMFRALKWMKKMHEDHPGAKFEVVE